MNTKLCTLFLFVLVLSCGCIYTSTPQKSVNAGAVNTVPLLSQPTTQAAEEAGFETPAVTATGTYLPAEACPAGQDRCSGVCVDLQSDGYHCGSCDTTCLTGQTCSSGICTASSASVCPEGQTRCDSSCTDTRYDPNNCGTCGSTCPLGLGCVDGACTGTPGPSCPSSQLMCSGVCINYLTDSTNCGSCSHSCFTGSSCKAGICQCPSGETACTKPLTLSPLGRTAKPVPFCTNLNTNHENCGACNHVCGVKETCCSGNCVNLNIDPYNCGACKKRCPGPLDPASERFCRLGHCSATPP